MTIMSIGLGIGVGVLTVIVVFLGGVILCCKSKTTSEM